MHYGKRDFQPDGSYVTTLWFVCFYVPIAPIQSKRIKPTGEVTYYALRPRKKHLLLEKMRPNMTQVLCVYAWFAAELASFIAAKMLELWWIAIPGVLLLGLPWMLRRRALERVKVASERMAMGLSPELSD